MHRTVRIFGKGKAIKIRVCSKFCLCEFKRILISLRFYKENFVGFGLLWILPQWCFGLVADFTLMGKIVLVLLTSCVNDFDIDVFKVSWVTFMMLRNSQTCSAKWLFNIGEWFSKFQKMVVSLQLSWLLSHSHCLIVIVDYDSKRW